MQDNNFDSARPRIWVVALAATVLLGSALPARAADAKPAKPAAAKPQSTKTAPKQSAPTKPVDEDLYGPPIKGMAVPKPAPKPAPEANEPKELIRELAVRGNQRVGEDRILLTIPISPGDKVGKSDILDAIQRIYGMGYFQDVKAGTEPMVGGERLVFTVVENPVLGDVTFEGVTKVETKKLEAFFQPMKGDIINYNTVKEAVEKLQKVYTDAGYPLARVADMRLAPGGILQLRIAEGRIHDIKVSGNEETKPYVVLRELTSKPGEVFNAEKIKNDLRRVYNLNYFEAINLKFEPAPNDEVTVVIDVKEKQTGSINLGAGYSTQQGILGMASVKKDNLFGTGQQVGLDFSISQYLQMSGELTYFNPWIDNNRTGLGGSLYVRRFNNFLADFREDRQGFSLSTSRPLFGDPISTPWRGSAGFTAEHVTTYENVLFGGNVKAVDPATNKPIMLNPNTNGTGGIFDFGVGDNVLRVNAGLSYDTRDIVMNPTEGSFDQVSLEPGLVNGFSPLVRATGSASQFFPLPALPWAPTERSTLAFDLHMGLIGGGQVPGYERFYSTGPYLIRGWPEYVNPLEPGGLGTRYPLNYFQGSNVATATLEYRFPIFNIVSGVLFGDTGMFWDTQFDPRLLHSGYGLGLRLNTPLGPIRLDYGMSGQEPGTWHFSIGQKF